VALWPSQLVKVRAGKRGSGWAVGHSGVLTALHVVRRHLANPYHPETNAKGIRCVAVTGGPAGEGLFDCAVVWRDEAADLTLLQIAEADRKRWWDRLIDEELTILAATGTDPIYDVSAIGFPDATLDSGAKRPDPDQPTGTLMPSSGVPGRVGFDVGTSTPKDHPLWQGLSGAAVREAVSGRLFAIVVQAVPERASRRLYASPLPDPDTDTEWTQALKQVGATPVLEDRYAPWARRFLACYDSAGRPWLVGQAPQLSDFGVRRARDDLAPSNRPYFPFVGRPEADGIEAALNAALANADAPRMILLVGEPAVGKSRLAAEVVTRMPPLAEYRLIRPVPTQTISDLPEVFRRGRVLLWLDDLHRYPPSYLEEQQVRNLLTNPQLIIVATILRESLGAYSQAQYRTGATDLLNDGTLIARVDISDNPTWYIREDTEPDEADAVRTALAAAAQAGVSLGEYLAACAEPPVVSPPSAADLDGLNKDQIQLLRTSVSTLEDLAARLKELDGATPLSGSRADVFTCAQRSLNRAKGQFRALDQKVSIEAWRPDRRWASRFSDALEQVTRDVQAVEAQWYRATAITRSGRSQQNSQLRSSVHELLGLLEERYPSVFPKDNNSRHR
jgi:hypothetical protein